MSEVLKTDIMRIKHAVGGDESAIGKIATGGTKLSDIERFWDASGNFILNNPQTLTMTQGNGNRASITIDSSDTIDTLVAKLNTAIASVDPNNGLQQAKTVSGGSSANINDLVEKSNGIWARYVVEAGTTVGTGEVLQSTGGLHAVAGTLIIESAIAGNDCRIAFSGSDALLSALSLQTVREAKENNFTVNVHNAHTGKQVGNTVKIAGNDLVGVIHPNVDVRFDSSIGVDIVGSRGAGSVVGGMSGGHFAFSNIQGGGNTFVHIADRTLVLHVGANQMQDIGVGIANMGAASLGVDNLLVSDNARANQTIGKLDIAINKVSSERARLGAVQNRLEHTISNLTVASENLTASESRIRDVDMAKEMMRFTKYQILSNAATAMLSQANMMPQMALQLLR
jgi:flagellin